MRKLKPVIPYIVLFAVVGIIFGSGVLVGSQCFPKVVTETTVKYVEVIATLPEPPEQDPEFVSLGMFVASAYDDCIDCCGKDDGITATGTKAMQGRTIAVDPTVIPYGTPVIINGHTYIAEDTGGAIKGNKVDIFFSTHEEALQYGRRQVEVFVMR